jgi:hypothetical protein
MSVDVTFFSEILPCPQIFVHSRWILNLETARSQWLYHKLLDRVCSVDCNTVLHCQSIGRLPPTISSRVFLIFLIKNPV